MDISDLHTFLRVVDLGSLSGVARERNVPVSQVSRAITRLEALHKTRLLHRSTHGLSLTDEGQTVADYGRRISAALRDMADDIAPSGVLRGSLRVAVSAAMAHYVIAPSLAGLLALHPQLEIDLLADDRFVDLARDGVDLAIRTGKVADTLVARQIGLHDRRLYASPSYLAAHGQPVRVADLAMHRLITNSVAPELNRWLFKAEGADGQPSSDANTAPVELVVHGQVRANSTGVAMTMALHGLGIVRGNTAICAPLVERGQLVPVLADWVQDQSVPIYAVMLPERYRSPKVRAAIDYWMQWFAAESA
jgi:DNA-binding transcriptional LysR family regulator